LRVILFIYTLYVILFQIQNINKLPNTFPMTEQINCYFGGCKMGKKSAILRVFISLALILGVGSISIADLAFAVDIPIYEDGFEGTVNWSAENGVWQIGTPTSGPGGCHGGTNCAATVLGGDYSAETDSRFIGPYTSPWEQGVELPPLSINQEIHLRFWNWFSYSDYDSGQVQVSILDPESEVWSNWENVGDSIVNSSGGWSLKDVDLTKYAGKMIRIAFYHVAHRSPSYSPSEGAGWYIDDIQIISKEPAFTGDFEMGWVDWSASTGVWQVGTPSEGPMACYEGSQCAGTVLDGNYPAFTDSRLVSATMMLDNVAGSEEIHLRFWNWFSYSSYDSGQVQVSIYNPEGENWGIWEEVGDSVVNSSGGWSLKDVDLTEYAGQTIRIGFYHMANRSPSYSPSESSGWYIDDIQITKKVPVFTGDFEMGWMDWFADNGVWQVGTPSAGPVACYKGSQCAGTVLADDYPAFTDSRLVSATINLSNVSLASAYLSYWEWFSYSSYDYGEVQVSVWDLDLGQWSEWNTLAQISENSTAWTQHYVDLSDYIGEKIRIGFFHAANRSPSYTPSESHGWFIDNVELVGPTQIMPTIRNVSYSGYIPDPCTSPIDVFASDPFDSDPSYLWQIPDGGELDGNGASMEFIPDEIRLEPYRVQVAACSDITNLCSFTKTLNILTTVLHDYEPDGDIDGTDLKAFVDAFNPDEIERFALEFGLVACQ
jgi:hypothetical protein